MYSIIIENNLKQFGNFFFAKVDIQSIYELQDHYKDEINFIYPSLDQRDYNDQLNIEGLKFGITSLVTHEKISFISSNQNRSIQ